MQGLQKISKKLKYHLFIQFLAILLYKFEERFRINAIPEAYRFLEFEI